MVEKAFALIDPTPTPTPTITPAPMLTPAPTVEPSTLHSIADSLHTIKSFIDVLQGIGYYLTHPAALWNGFVNFSYWFCLLGCMLCILVGGTSGSPKIKRWAVILVLIYVIIKGVDLVI